jgi:hypothetical protein
MAQIVERVLATERFDVILSLNSPPPRPPRVPQPSRSSYSNLRINAPVAQRYPPRQGSVPVMWGTVLVLALGAATDPLRLGTVIVLVSLRRPVHNLLACWLGGMATGTFVGLGVLLLLRDFLPTVIHVTSSIGNFMHGRIQITIGVLMLLIAVGFSARQRVRVPVGNGDLAALAQPSTLNRFSQLTARAKHTLEGGHPLVAFAAGVGSVTPPEYAMALTIILASGSTIGTQLSAIVMFTVVVLTVVEVSLVSYLATPAKTQAVMLQLNTWVQAHHRRIIAVMLAAGGGLLVAKGIGIA